MITAAAFLLAAAAGALGRTALGHRLNVHDGFPFGTLVANLSGAFVLGTLHGFGAPEATVVGTGLVGTLTTFSSFTRDATALSMGGRWALAAVYILATMGGAVGAAAAGVALA